jgi:hypothetical protein
MFSVLVRRTIGRRNFQIKQVLKPVKRGWAKFGVPEV